MTNKATVHISHDRLYHNQIKCVDIDKFYIKEKVEKKAIHIDYVPSSEQCVDILTKGFLDKTFTKLVSKLGMRSIHSCTLGGE